MDAASIGSNHSPYTLDGEPGSSAPAHAATAKLTPPDDAAARAQPPFTFGMAAFATHVCPFNRAYCTIVACLRGGEPPAQPSVSLDAACARFLRCHTRCREAIKKVLARGHVPADERQRIVHAQSALALQFTKVKERYAAGWSGYLFGAGAAEVIRQIDALADNRARAARVHETSARIIEAKLAARQAEASAAQAASAPGETPATEEPAVESGIPARSRASVIVPVHPSPSLEAAISRAETMVNECFALPWPVRMQSDVEKLLIASGIDLETIDRFKHAATVRRASWLGWPFRWHVSRDMALIDRYAAAVAKIVMFGHRKNCILNAPAHANAAIAIQGHDLRFTGVPNEPVYAYVFLDFFNCVLIQSDVIADLHERFGL